MCWHRILGLFSSPTFRDVNWLRDSITSGAKLSASWLLHGELWWSRGGPHMLSLRPGGGHSPGLGLERPWHSLGQSGAAPGPCTGEEADAPAFALVEPGGPM